MYKFRIHMISASIFAIVFFIGAMYFGIQHGIDWALRKDAKAYGLDWAHHFTTRIPNLSINTNQDDLEELELALKLGNIGRLANDMLKIGHIHQIDFINSTCLCDISLGSYNKPFLDEKKKEVLTFHNDVSNTTSHSLKVEALKSTSTRLPKFFKRRIIKHMLLSTKKHKPRSISQDSKLQFPVNRPLTQSIIKDKTDQIFIREDVNAFQPTTFAEVYHPALLNGEVVYVIRLLVNLEDKKKHYTMLFYAIAAFVLLLLAFSFLYPMSKYWRAHREQQKAIKKSLYLSNHDILTGVANRKSFEENAPRIIKNAITKNEPCTLILLDLYNFSAINDFYGHHVGDQILTRFSQRLSDHFSKNSIVARLGGDELAILTSEKFDSVTNQLTVETEQNLLAFEIDGKFIHISFNAGIVQTPQHGKTLDQLLRNAGLALYQAKQQGDRSIVKYTNSMADVFRTKITLLKEFKAAILNHQIIPYYQPIINISTGKVDGFESLARWQHPEKGILSPVVFDSALGDREISALLGSEMLRMITRDMAEWQANGIDFEYVALNITEGDLLRPAFVLDIAKSLADNGLQGPQLVIEVTETCVFGDNKGLFLKKLSQLQIAGCRIALDDFGTGYSSITHIKELPCSTVKVDKSFIDNITHNLSDQAIVKALFEMGQSIGFKLVLEGVEDDEQLTFAKQMGADFVQGYFYSKPIASTKVPSFLSLHKGNTHKTATGL